MLDPNMLHVNYKKSKSNKRVKIENYTYDDFDFYMWDYEEQTKIKHKVLEEYLYVWAIKLGSANNINYYDGFSGCGTYYDSNKKELCFGSPIIAKQQFLKAHRDNKSTFYFNEKEECNINNLKKVFTHLGVPSHNINYYQGEFETNIIPFLDSLENNSKPTFFMIDPYGINVNFNTIKRIMNIPKTEVFFNFMYNFTRRFTNMTSVENNLTNLFGTDKWKEYKKYKLYQKENALIELYRQQLKSCSKYVYQYRMCFPNDRRTYYYLFHATNNREGCSIMKDAFAKINVGNVEFLGPNQPNPEQLNLIDFNLEKIQNLKSLIWEKYKGQTIEYGNIVDTYIDSTPYLERHIREAIKDMDKEFLDVQHIKTKTTVNIGDIINFYEIPVKKIRSTQISLF